MTVIDASVFVNAFAFSSPAADAALSELRDQTALEVPAIFAAEVASALRALVLRNQIAPDRARDTLDRVRAARTIRFPFEPFSDRVWELRANLSVYDAWYVALAEWLDTDLATADARLANAPGLRCRVRLL